MSIIQIRQPMMIRTSATFSIMPPSLEFGLR